MVIFNCVGTGIIWATQTFQKYFDAFLKPYRISGNKERFTFQTKYWYRSRFLKAVVSQVFSHVLYVEKNSNHSIFNRKFSQKSSFTSWKFIKESEKPQWDPVLETNIACLFKRAVFHAGFCIFSTRNCYLPCSCKSYSGYSSFSIDIFLCRNTGFIWLNVSFVSVSSCTDY